MEDGHFLDLESQAESVERNETNIFLQQNLEQTILSIFWRCGKLGAAVFSTETIEIQLLNDITDTSPEFPVCHQLIRQVEPTTIISCNTLSVTFLDHVKSLTNNCRINCSIDSNAPKISLNLLANKHFQYERCKMRVFGINIEGKMTDLLEETRINYLHSFINFSCRMTISAFGALLYFLDTYVSKIMLQIPSQHILSLRVINLNTLVWIDDESYDALEVFSSNSRPSIYKLANMNSKDGFSILGLYNRCLSSVGTRFMRVLLNHPTKDIAELKLRHEVIEFFLKPENQIVLKNLQECLKLIGNISTIISRIVGTQATPLQWKTFYRTIHNIVIVGEICRSRNEEVKFFKQLSDAMDKRLYVISQVIENVIDFEESMEQARFTVKQGAFPELDEIREQHKTLPLIMEQVASKELTNLPDFIKSCSLVYLPEIGYLLGIPAWKENLTEEELMLPNMQFKFILKNVVHYKTARCQEMDEVLGDSHLIILKHETEIMYQVVDYIRGCVPVITTMFQKIKLLDCLIAFSDVAREFELVKPILTSDRTIHIKKGRHMLQQLCVNTFVANDFVSSPDSSLVKILTGPNSSGKSVYLKQMALIVYLAHIGSFVPAQVAKIGLIDYLHARIHTIESISTALSSFMLDLRQMYSCLNYSTPNTLIVIDEFGKGTADTDGLALLAANVLHFVQRGIRCPHIIVSTHFHRLFSFLPETTLIKPQTFEFMVEGEEITYLYAVKDGAAQSSFAHHAAINAGIPKNIVDRSNEIFFAIQSGQAVQRKEDNQRTQLVKRRITCLRKMIEHPPETDDDLEEIIDSLNNCRY